MCIRDSVVADVLSRTDFDNSTEVDLANTYKIFITKEVGGIDMRKINKRLSDRPRERCRTWQDNVSFKSDTQHTS